MRARSEGRRLKWRLEYKCGARESAALAGRKTDSRSEEQAEECRSVAAAVLAGQLAAGCMSGEAAVPVEGVEVCRSGVAEGPVAAEVGAEECKSVSARERAVVEVEAAPSQLCS
jgi:hypothetical protein